jgi:hypothetical protein
MAFSGGTQRKTRNSQPLTRREPTDLARVRVTQVAAGLPAP